MKIDCEYTQEVVCPHCRYEHQDSWDHQLDGTPQEFVCEECNEPFMCYSDVDVTYCSSKIDPQPDPQPDPRTCPDTLRDLAIDGEGEESDGN